MPGFATDYTANKVKYATTPAALRCFEHVEEVAKAGFLNEDFGAATFDDGMRMVSTGEAAHYPSLTFGIGNIQQNFRQSAGRRLLRRSGQRRDQERVDDLDALGAPFSAKGDNSRGGQEISRFRRLEGRLRADGEGRAIGLLSDQGLHCSGDVPQAVSDMLPYFETEGRTDRRSSFCRR